MRHCLFTSIPSASPIPHLLRTLDKSEYRASFAGRSLRNRGPRVPQIANAQRRCRGRFEHGRAPNYWGPGIFRPSLSHAGGYVATARKCQPQGQTMQWNAISATLVWCYWCERGIERANRCRKAIRKRKWRCGGRAWEVLDCGLLFFDVVIPTVAIFGVSLFHNFIHFA